MNYYNLSDREKQVLDLMVAGKSGKEIGRELFVSHKTIETHRYHIMKKLDAHCVADVVRKAMTPKRGPQVGWQCPVCQTVNAPWKSTCAGSHAGRK